MQDFTRNSLTMTEKRALLARLPVPQHYEDYWRCIAAVHRAGFSDAEVEAWAATGDKYVPGEWVQQRAFGVDRYDGDPVTEGTFFWFCQQAGILTAGDGSLAPDENPENRFWHFRPYTPEDLNNLPDLEWIVPGILPNDSLVMFSGDPKSGKSSLLTHWAFNDDWMGKPVQPVRWLHVTEEDERWVHERLLSCGVNYDRSLALTRYLSVGHSHNSPWSYDGLIEELGNAVEKNNANADATPFRVIVIDTMLNWAGIDNMNDSASVAAALAPLRWLCNKLPNVTVVAVHHNRKPSTDANDVFSSFLGSVAFRGLTDFNLIMTKRGNALSLHTEGRGSAETERLDMQLSKIAGVIEWRLRLADDDVLQALGTLELHSQQVVDALDDETITRRAMSRTLDRLHQQGLVSKRKVGKFTLYAATNAVAQP